MLGLALPPPAAIPANAHCCLFGACRRDPQRDQNPRHPGERRGPLHAGHLQWEAGRCRHCKFTRWRAATAVDPGVRRDDRCLERARLPPTAMPGSTPDHARHATDGPRRPPGWSPCFASVPSARADPGKAT